MENQFELVNGRKIFGPGAEVRFSKQQLLFLAIIPVSMIAMGALLQFNLQQYLEMFVAVCTCFFGVMFCFSLVAAVNGIREDSMIEVTEAECTALAEFPFITVLVPSFKEAKIARQIVRSLSALKYPIDCFEVIVVLEEGDDATINAYSSIDLPYNFRVVVRPSGGIMTKPAAMNYLLEELYISPSEITVVFDTEDMPDVWQLHKAVIAFQKAWELDERVVCIQARLAFSQNANKNWLTRMLNLDYLQHFGLVLPGLSKLGFISPLGGTSNYILTRILMSVGGWDPHNVTEDLDLAVRFARLKYRIRVLNSVTAEEAVTKVGALFGQRSRWNKGGIQTYFRHMRNPVRLYKDLGFVGFCSFQLVVGAPLVLALINPIFWGLTAVYAITQSEFIKSLYPPLVFYIAMFCFSAGNYMYIYMLKTSAFKTKQYVNVVFGLFAPIYWALLSIATYKALFEFLASGQAASKWNKTEHAGNFNEEAAL